MDETLSGAITAVRLDPGSAQRWFEAVVGVQRELRDSGAGDDWDHFRERFPQVAQGDSFDSDQIDGFLRYLNDNGRMDTVGQLTDLGSDLPVYYERLVAGRGAGPEVDDGRLDDDYGTVVPVDTSRWDGVVERYGPGWARWEGDEEGWIRYRDWVYAGTNAQDPDLYALVYGRFDPLNSLPPAARAERLREWGFTVNAVPAAGSAPESGAVDEWTSVVRRYGAGWPGWPGEEDGWARFRDWLYIGTNDEDPALYALVYERIDPLNAMPLAERIDRLRSWGFTVETGAGDEAGQPELTADDQEVVAALADELGPQVEAALAGLQADRPDLLAGLTDEQLQEAITTVLANQLGE